MAFGQGILNQAQKVIIATVTIVLLSLNVLPFVPQVVRDFLNWQIGTTEFTVGAVVGLVGLWVAFSVYKRTL